MQRLVHHPNALANAAGQRRPGCKSSTRATQREIRYFSWLGPIGTIAGTEHMHTAILWPACGPFTLIQENGGETVRITTCSQVAVFDLRSTEYQ